MKVLIIHQHFRLPSQGGAIRSYYLARALVDHGITVDVITAGSRNTNGLHQVEGINIHYLPIDYNNRFGFWKRGTAFLQFAWSAAVLAGRLPGLDVCYAISVPLTTGLSALWLKRTRGIPYIFEVGDLWPDAPIELGFIKDPSLKWILRRLEKAIYRRSAGVVALSGPIKESVERKLPTKQVVVIPNMADTEFFTTNALTRASFEKYKVDGKFIVSYIGAVGFANGLEHVIECARGAMRASLHIHFFICGDGALLDQHKLNVESIGLTNVTFVPFTTRQGVKELMDTTDAVFVSYKPFKILETGSPNKYFDGLAAGKLILINFEGWMKDEVEREQCGLYIDRRRPEKFADVIKPFIQDLELLHRYQLAARDLALRRYSRTQLGEEFVTMVRSTVR